MTTRLISSGIVSVEAPQARLDVGDRDAELGGHEAAASVEFTSPYDDHDGRLGARRSAGSSATSSAAVCAAWLPDPTPRLRSGVGQAELLEEDVGHQRVVVLAGVDERWRDAARRRAPRTTGAAFMKFGRAPTTWTTGPGVTSARASGREARRGRGPLLEPLGVGDVDEDPGAARARQLGVARVMRRLRLGEGPVVRDEAHATRAHPAEATGGVAGHEGVARHVMGDDRTGADGRELADLGRRDDHGTRPDRAALAERDRTGWRRFRGLRGRPAS